MGFACLEIWGPPHQVIIKLNEILRFYDGFDKLVEYTYNRLQEGLNGTLENLNNITKKPLYIKVKD